MRLPRNLLRGHLFALAVLQLSAAVLAAQDNDLYRQAVSAFQQQNFGVAAALFEKSEAADPGKSDALLMAAKARVHLQEFDAADRNLRAYLKANPGSADA